MRNYFKFIFRSPQSAFVFTTLLVFSISIPLTEYSREDFSFFTLFFTGMFVAFIIVSYVNYKNR